MNPTAEHFWYSHVFWQHIEGIGLFAATIALVLVTFFLVSATKSLAKVAEDSWKSNVSPVVATAIKHGKLSRPDEAIVRVINECEVPIKECRVELFHCYLDTGGGEPIVSRWPSPHQKPLQQFSAKDLLRKDSSSQQWQFWDDAQKTLRTGFPPGATGIANGWKIQTRYTHSITGQSYSYNTYVKLEPAPAAMEVTYLFKTTPMLIT